MHGAPQPIRDNQLVNPDAANGQERPEQGRPLRLGWARLLKRLFDLDLTHCQHCGGDLTTIAALLERDAIGEDTKSLGLGTKAAAGRASAWANGVVKPLVTDQRTSKEPAERNRLR